jgi:hypothetical protein
MTKANGERNLTFFQLALHMIKINIAAMTMAVRGIAIPKNARRKMPIVPHQTISEKVSGGNPPWMRQV